MNWQKTGKLYFQSHFDIVLLRLLPENCDFHNKESASLSNSVLANNYLYKLAEAAYNQEEDNKIVFSQILHV